VPVMPLARPGQFMHVSPEPRQTPNYRVFGADRKMPHDDWRAAWQTPMLRRGFSIASLNRDDPGRSGADIDLIYRVVGIATRWMESLREGDSVSVLGPLGNVFPVRQNKAYAWLIAGGVGLPPMLWLAKSLADAGRRTVAFCGAQSAELLPLTLGKQMAPVRDAGRATLSADEFSSCGVPVVVSTDDGTLGFHGHIGSALVAYSQANSIPPEDIVIYTCGPERMMRFVAEYCGGRGIECHVCMERAMACGTGTCQSCVVPVRDTRDSSGWVYRLCCTEGPVFDARNVLWDTPNGQATCG